MQGVFQRVSWKSTDYVVFMYIFKGTVSRDFLLLVFSVSLQPQSIPLGPFQIFRKFVDIFASQGAPLVSMRPLANFATSCATVVDTGGKFAASVNDTSDNLLPVSMTPLANNGNNIRLLRP
jgi:hypothetical protein